VDDPVSTGNGIWDQRPSMIQTLEPEWAGKGRSP
jgi:hypothetical protein